MLRTHTCGELTKKDEKKKVALCGWVDSVRTHGSITFIDLKDRYGITQIILGSDLKNSDEAKKLNFQDVVRITGTVKVKPEPNKKLKTGDIEVSVSELEVLNKSEKIPLDISDETTAGDETRLKYRFLDLRRPVMQERLAIRHKAAMAAREYLSDNSFLEIETPLLIRATPEGARDYVVPSRIHPGKFFALPQSPQLYKQLLMVSGMDRYFQLARCLRDEDLRQDRQPEFTQIDMEMSFIDIDDIIGVCEGLIKHIWKKAIGVSVDSPFKRITYDEAMNKYGSDKPDLRLGLELTDVTDILKKSDFSIFKSAECIKCINPEKDFSRKDIDELTELAKKSGAKGLVSLKVLKNDFEGSAVKYLNDDIKKELLKITKAKEGSTLLFVADKWVNTCKVLGDLRLELSRRLDLIKDKKEFKFVWIVDFPLFEWDPENNRWAPMHHIFSMPKDECIKYLDKDPSKVLGKLYDLALNGVEIGGGSIRIHRKDLQEKVLKVIGMDYKKAEERFGFLLNSFRYGAPPHGGLAFGMDRLCSLLCGFNDIREVMAFPKNKAAECPMDGCPATVEDEQLKDLHIKHEF
jgi:aspartyl-tRNA synthetase